MAVNWDNIDSQVHCELINELIEKGSCPFPFDLSERLKVAVCEIESSFLRLAENHALVLHPGTTRVWVIHPFSVSPTTTWVETDERGWWAPCLWCAFGMAFLLKGEVRIHSRLGGRERLALFRIMDGVLAEGSEYVIHFSIPPRDAWENVHHFCACVQPFRNEEEIPAWCKAHGLPLGESITPNVLLALARVWYGGHRNPDWIKWNARDAQRIFGEVGLNGPFWDLGSHDGRY
ncbi:MAG: hypothetical protein HYV97_02680 [Bdellovibrio sp.]|nr:hypothetical protein [Bdellovibrio sp.]